MSSRAAPQVAVLMGGPSAEREVSLSSGHECAAALREAGFDVIEIDPGHEGGAALAAKLSQLPKGAVVFNALHGRWGEDGCVQGLLEWMGLPYTHSGVLSSALAMDKERAKLALRGAGIRVCDSVIASREEVRASHVLPPPYVVKPANEGSSVGVYIVQAENNGPPQLDDKMPAQVMVETYAPGRELTVSVMGAPGEERAFCVTEIITEGWYDYDAKYKAGGSRHVLPADVPQEITDLCLDWAVKAHVALGCRGLSRSDFRWDDARGTDGLICLETNTQPGMTPTSLAPEQAARCGISFSELCRWLVEDASCMR